MRRIDIFRSLIKQYFYRSIYKRLNKKEVALCEMFLIENESLNRNEFTLKLNRWFLDEMNKPKRHADMWALLSNVASASK